MGQKDRIISKAAKAYDRVRPRLMPGTRLFLLKRAGQTKRLAVVAEIVGGYWVRWSSFREQTQFRMASNSAELEEAVAQTSHIGFGEATAEEIDVFAVSPDQRDRIAPTGASPFWKLYGTRQANERFNLSVTADPFPVITPHGG